MGRVDGPLWLSHYSKCFKSNEGSASVFCPKKIMKILLLAPQPFFQNRGTPIAVKLLIETLCAQGHRISVLTYPEGEDVDIDGCEIIRLPAFPGVKNVKPGPSWKKIFYDLVMFFKVRKMIRKREFSLIHCIEESAFMAYTLKSYGIPYVYDMDSVLSEQIGEKYASLQFLLPLLERLEKNVIKGSIGILAVCRAIEEKVIRYIPGKYTQRLEDITLLPTEDDCSSDKGVDLQIDGKVVMYIGNLEKYQGIDLLLDSFAIVTKQSPDVFLVIVGGSDEDIKYYQIRCVNLEISEKIMFVGPRPISELSQYFAQADILVSPRIKGFNTPMKIYSYLDSGKAVLATCLPTHTQVLDEEIACLVEPDPQSMATGMDSLLHNSALRKELAGQAKQRVKQEYTLTAYKRKLIAFYSKIEAEISEELTNTNSALGQTSESYVLPWE